MKQKLIVMFFWVVALSTVSMIGCGDTDNNRGDNTKPDTVPYCKSELEEARGVEEAEETKETKKDLSAHTGEELHCRVDFPWGLSEATFQITGGTGDADIYVRYGAQPTTWNYDYKSSLLGNEEVIKIDNPSRGSWYVMVYAYEAFDGVTLYVNYK